MLTIVINQFWSMKIFKYALFSFRYLNKKKKKFGKLFSITKLQ